MKLTQYFTEQVLQKRPYVKLEWCLEAIAKPQHKEIQSDNRIRHWIYIPEFQRFLRVITLEDGETIHNAFFDRGFKPEV